MFFLDKANLSHYGINYQGIMSSNPIFHSKKLER
jgi:hypothetical protein